MKNKHKYFMVIIVCAMACVFCNPKKSSIIEIKALRKIVSTNGRLSRFDLFIVEDYDNDEKVRRQIEALLNENQKDLIDSFYQYDMTFYKESDITSYSKLVENPKLLYTYSQYHDLIYNFSWMNGKLVSRMKFENGKVVDD